MQTNEHLLKPPHIVIIDDNVEIAELIATYLRKHFYQVAVFSEPTDVIGYIEKSLPDLIIVDLLMPKLDGLSLSKEIKQRWAIPIIMLTAVSDEVEKVVAFETACDDYLVKPCELRVILAHIKSLLRRRHSGQYLNKASVKRLCFNGFRLELELRRLVTPEGIEVSLSLAEYAILSFFAHHPNQVHTRREICASIKKLAPLWDERRVDLVISHLRKKIGRYLKEEALFKTIKQQGYLFAATVRSET